MGNLRLIKYSYSRQVFEIEKFTLQWTDDYRGLSKSHKNIIKRERENTTENQPLTELFFCPLFDTEPKLRENTAERDRETFCPRGKTAAREGGSGKTATTKGGRGKTERGGGRETPVMEGEGKCSAKEEQGKRRRRRQG
ncbi:hypothetical protein ACOSQ4_016951 [Xanthoceras sorbifolium]